MVLLHLGIVELPAQLCYSHPEFHFSSMMYETIVSAPLSLFNSVDFLLFRTKTKNASYDFVYVKYIGSFIILGGFFVLN